MKRSRDTEEVRRYLSDESRMPGGSADEVAWAESPEEAAALLAEWSAAGIDVTVSGGGTGVVGGRVPLGGAVLAVDRLDRILSVDRHADGGGRMTVEAGVPLETIQRRCAEEGLHYPPDPTEYGALIGGTLATNASGARTLRFGPTRGWVDAVRFALPDGRLLSLRRGDVRAAGGRFEARLDDGSRLVVPVPSWRLPGTTKHSAGYHAGDDMDLLDLLIGSEGTLGVFLEAELRLLPAPAEVLAGLVFFPDERAAYDFVCAARQGPLEPWALELFSASALALLRERDVPLPEGADTAILFEEGIAAGHIEAAEERLEAWLELALRHGASDESWIGASLEDDRRFREFRHAIPLSINEKLAERGVTKVSTDTAALPGRVPELLAEYRALLRRVNLEYAIFGHIGDDHVHVNIIPRDPSEQQTARDVFWEMIEIAVRQGGSVAAEHGLGKLKARALELQFGAAVVEEMRAIRRVFDPEERLGRGTLFPT